MINIIEQVYPWYVVIQPLVYTLVLILTSVTLVTLNVFLLKKIFKGK